MNESGAAVSPARPTVMTAAEQLIARARNLEIQLWVSDGMLRFRGPRAALSDELRAQLLTHKASIIDALAGPLFQRAPEVRAIDIPEDCVPIWNLVRTGVLSVSHTNSTHMAYRFRCPLDLRALERSVHSLARQHNALRCCLLEDQRGLRLEFDHDPELLVLDLSGCASSEVDGAIAEAAKDIVWRPFSAGECMFRPFVFKLPAAENVIGFVVHHLMVDAWSFRQIPDRWMAEYERQLRPQPENEPRPDYLQCSDYLLGVANWSKTLHFQRRLDYWKETLRGVVTSRVPPDRVVVDYDARSCHRYLPIQLDVERVTRLTAAAASLGVTLSDLLLAGVALALQRELKLSDICLRHLWHGRSEPRLFDMIASTVNTVILRIRVDPDSRLPDIARQVHRVALEAVANQIPSYYVDKELNETGTSAFVQTNFQLREHAGEQAGASSTVSAPLERVRLTSPHGWFNTPRNLQAHDINLFIANGAVSGGVVYLESVYDDATIKRFIQRFERALDFDDLLN